MVQVAALASQLCDDAIQAVHAIAFGKDEPRACAAGCAWCCYQQVTTSPPVIFFLARALASSGEPELHEALLEETRASAAKVRGLKTGERLRLKLACPLLAEDGTCIVYPVRPLACRGWNTYDAKACRKSVERPDSVPQTRAHLAQLRVAHAIERAVIDALDALELKSAPVELIGALSLVLEDETALDRWLDGQDVFESVRPVDDVEAAVRWITNGGA